MDVAVDENGGVQDPDACGGKEYDDPNEFGVPPGESETVQKRYDI